MNNGINVQHQIVDKGRAVVHSNDDASYCSELAAIMERKETAGESKTLRYQCSRCRRIQDPVASTLFFIDSRDDVDMAGDG